MQGLRKFGYSWADIAHRLGVTRQAAQMRWGNRDDRGRLDPRILEPGLGLTVAQLVAVFADHHPGNPQASTCPGCAYAPPGGAPRRVADTEQGDKIRRQIEMLELLIQAYRTNAVPEELD